MKQKILLVIVTLLMTNSFAFAQSAKEILSGANSAKLVSKNFYDEIHFWDKLGYFTIEVKIDTVSYTHLTLPTNREV